MRCFTHYDFGMLVAITMSWALGVYLHDPATGMDVKVLAHPLRSPIALSISVDMELGKEIGDTCLALRSSRSVVIHRIMRMMGCLRTCTIKFVSLYMLEGQDVRRISPLDAGTVVLGLYSSLRALGGPRRIDHLMLGDIYMVTRAGTGHWIQIEVEVD